MMRNYFIIVMVIFCTGCKSNITQSLSQLFVDHKKLTHTLLPISDEDILVPIYFMPINDYLVTTNYRTKQILRIYDIRNGCVVNDLVHVGRAEKEMSGIVSLEKTDNELMLYSDSSGKILRIPFDDLKDSLTSASVIKLDKSYSNIWAVSDNSYVSFTNIGPEVLKGAQFALLDSMGGFVKSFGRFFDDGTSYSFTDKIMAHQGKLRIDPTGEYIVYASSFGFMMRFMRKSMDQITEIQEYVFDYPKYQPISNPDTQSYSTSWAKDCNSGALAMASSPNYCFVLYEEDKLVSNRDWMVSDIYVFDWVGNPITKLQLDRSVQMITYDQKTNSLIALTSNDDSGKNEFIKYKLDDNI